MSDIIIEPFNSKQHDRQLFNCGIEVLNVYLKQKANQEQKKRLNLTYVAIKSSDTLPKPILGYYTLSNSSVALHTVQTELKKHTDIMKYHILQQFLNMKILINGTYFRKPRY